MRPAVVMVAAAAIGVSVAAASCGSNGNSASTRVPRHRGQASIGSATTGPAGGGPAGSDRRNDARRARELARRTFGSACAKIPATGRGSRSWLASVPVVTAASNNPLLTDLVHAADVAGLVATLDSASAVTLFAPDNSAFKALGRGNYNTLMANRADLAKVLKYHIVKGRVTPVELAERKPLTTLAGLQVHPVKSGNVYKVNGVRVICGNLHTANATIYIVDGVLDMSAAGAPAATVHPRG